MHHTILTTTVVVTDIDDTIKTSRSDSPAWYIVRALCTFSPAGNMPSLFNTLLQTESISRFIYLSAAPSILYPFFYFFILKYYPRGTLILRNLGWASFTALFETSHEHQHKVERISHIYRSNLAQRVILIGDNVRKDPEVYAEIYRLFPMWVHQIWIRKVKNGDKEDTRLKSVFKSIPPNIWGVVTDSGEVTYACKSISIST
jgi:phosphatidate phosphatase APP1